MNKFKLFIIGFLIILVFLLGRKCNNSPKNDLKTIRDTLIVHKIDTIRDTLEVFKMKIKTIFRPIEVFKPVDSSLYINTRQYRIYKDTIRDTNLVIFNEDTIFGYLVSRNINYKLLVPLKIYDTTVIKITKEVPKLAKIQVKIGVMTNNRSIIPNLEISRDRSNYMIGYDPLNKIPYFGYKYTIYYK